MEPPERDTPFSAPLQLTGIDAATESRQAFFSNLPAPDRARLLRWWSLEILKLNIPGPPATDRLIAEHIAKAFLRNLSGPLE